MSRVNLSKVGESSELKEGTYVAKITDTDLGFSKKGDIMLTVTFTVSGNRIRDWFLINENSLWKLRKLFRALGQDPENYLVDTDTGFIHDANSEERIPYSEVMVNKEVVVDLVKKTVNEKEYLYVTRYAPVGEMENSEPLEEAPF